MTAAPLPLAGLRVLDYGQYVAGPFATMLLADLGADVVKVEPPRGDEWRRYDPFEEGESRYFYALNRGKRSVVLDLKTDAGRARSRELIAGADALVHNCLPERARRFGLDRDGVHAVNPRCVTVCVSAFGSGGPDAERPAYDLIGQALSGLLLADPRSGDACAAAHRRARARRLHRRAARRPRGGGGPARPRRERARSSRCRCWARRWRSRRSGSWRWTVATSRPRAGRSRTPRTSSGSPGRWSRSRRSIPTTARTRVPTGSSRSPASTPSSGGRCASCSA